MDERYEREPEEIDLDLARRLADGRIEQPPEPDPDGERLLARLSALRDAHVAERAVSAASSARMWASVSAAVGRQDLAALRLVRHPVFRYAVAAAVAGVVLWSSITPRDAWRVVASSGASSISYRSPDGSAVTLRPNSRLLARGDGARAYRLDGEAFFDVVQGDGPFSVETADAVVTVLGTRFDVSAWGPATEVYLVEGSVRFEHRATGRGVQLTPGQRSFIGPGGPSEPADAPREDAVDWMGGELSFTSRPAGLVVAELAQHFGVTIALPEEVAPESLSGRVLLGDLETALADVGTVLGGRFTRGGSGGYRFER